LASSALFTIKCKLFQIEILRFSVTTDHGHNCPDHVDKAMKKNPSTVHLIDLFIVQREVI
jgi:hypothetical protein